MEKVSVEELNKMRNELVELEENIGKFKDEVEELKKNDFVMSYIHVNHEYQKRLRRIKFLKSEIPYQKMLNCDHYFVINEVESGFDGHRTDTTYIVTCVKCGLTNKYMNSYYDPYYLFNEPYLKMNEIYKSSGCRTVHGYCDYDELDFYKEEYDRFKEIYPNASDDDVEKHIALVKKMKEGKSC